MTTHASEARPSTGQRPSLGACLVFAACAAAAASFWVASTASLLGYGRASASCALALAAFYPLFVAPTVERGVAATVVTSLLVAPIAWLRLEPCIAFAGMAVLVGVVRSTLLYPRPFPRALPLEAVLGAAGLAAVAYFHDGSFGGAVLSLWSFWLIQAGFALGPAEPRASDDRVVDPFDRAHAAAVAILERRQDLRG